MNLCRSSHKIRTGPLPSDQRQAFPNSLSTNHIVRALYIRAQRHPWVVKNRVPTFFLPFFFLKIWFLIFLFSWCDWLIFFFPKSGKKKEVNIKEKKRFFFSWNWLSQLRLTWLSIFHAISIEIWRFFFLAYHKKSGLGLAVSHSDSSSYQREKEIWEWRWECLLISKLIGC